MEPLRYRKVCIWPMFLKLSILLYFLVCIVHLAVTYYGMQARARKEDSVTRGNDMVFHHVTFTSSAPIDPTTKHPLLKTQPKTKTHTSKPKSKGKKGTSKKPWWKSKSTYKSKQTPSTKPMRPLKITSKKWSGKSKTCTVKHTFCSCAKTFSCWRVKEYLRNKAGLRQSSCSSEATLAGPNQKVVSFVLFGSRNNKNAWDFPYHEGIQRNVEAVKKIYPGWKMRVYSNLPLIGEECSLLCNEDILFWCDVNNIPKMGNLSDVWPPMWRFLPIGDPLVDEFISRDVDSLVGRREWKAVKEWEKNWPNKTFHVMRDHPTGHRRKILAGLWGAKVKKLANGEGKDLQTKLMKLGRGGTKKERQKGFDQVNLAKVLWQGKYFDKILAHDTFLCKEYNQTTCQKFPDKNRAERDHVGRYLSG